MVAEAVAPSRGKAVILLSGGMDSTTLLYDVIDKGFEVYPISFNYGQKHSLELGAARFTCIKLGLPHKVLDLRVLGEIAPSALTRKGIDIPQGTYQEESMKQTVVPNRNMVLLALAASYAIGVEAGSIWYGAHGGDHAIYPDCRGEFVEKLAEVLKVCDWKPITLVVPYLHWDKVTILREGLDLGVDYSLTWTCYEGRKVACGQCGSCIERLEAFKIVGVKDPIVYEGSR